MTAVMPTMVAVSGSCCCCLSTNNLKQMTLGVYTDGKLETYSQMLNKCFKMEFMTDVHKEYDYLICQKCIHHLQLSYKFINQVIKAQIFLQKQTVKTESDVNALDEVEVNISKPIIVEIPLDDKLCIKEERNIVFDLNNTKDKSDYTFDDSVQSNKPEFTDDNKTVNTDLIKANENDVSSEDNNISNLELIDDITTNIIKKRSVNSKKDKRLPYKLDKDDLKCKICNETFIYHALLTRHMCVHFPNYICDICGKAFPTLNRLKSHLHSHDLTQQKCNICNRKLKGFQNLQTHIRQVHKNPLVYKCPHCPERFDRMSYNKKLKHLVEVHNDEPKKHKCELCPQRFSRTGGLKSHIRRVHLSERNYSCTECTSTFYGKTGLRNHMLKHSGDKQFKCDVCHKSYGRRSTLYEHMKIHNNIKKFVCQVCERAFTQKCSLKAHMKIHVDVERESV